ncbi:MAG: hypothetical protein HZC44_07895 [Geobacter sp.]|nr:hypothetical protein [Geobacter sp.]
MKFSPGTVSKILWHFTGGPIWDNNLNKQGKELKSTQAAFKALCGIIDSKELRTGSYHELVKVVVSKIRQYNTVTKTFETKENQPVIIKSSPVCCVADIPIQHLSYHSRRYGKMAIGFYRSSGVKAGFNPVMYTLEHSSLSNSLHDGYRAIESTDPWSAKSALEDLESNASEILEENKVDDAIDISSVESELDCIEVGYERVKKNYENFLAYVKTFDQSEFDSIYCEREWRCTCTFIFDVKDIAMVVLPKDQDGRNYYEEFIKIASLPRNVPILCWEDLIEH